MMEWINTHDVAINITPEYFNSLTTKTDAELEEEVQFWDEIYTAQHYGKYKSRVVEPSKPKSFLQKIKGWLRI